MHISELAKLTGVSIRTLHYYDKIQAIRRQKELLTLKNNGRKG